MKDNLDGLLAEGIWPNIPPMRFFEMKKDWLQDLLNNWTKFTSLEVSQRQAWMSRCRALQVDVNELPLDGKSQVLVFEALPLQAKVACTDFTVKTDLKKMTWQHNYFGMWLKELQNKRQKVSHLAVVFFAIR